ncbi:MAG: NUDIX domain-containing protein [Patescibacteria group bacterium]|nr:NUDIX domain-containing protein [Patescibacteria group bacterium]
MTDPIPDQGGRRGAVAICPRADGRLLVIRRSAGVIAPLTYCFPGGGLEPGESEPDALVRELQEELAVAIRPIRCLWQCRTAWNVELAWWLAHLPAGAEPIPNPAEVASVHWFTSAEMAAQPALLPSNREFLNLVLSGQVSLAADA